MFASAFVFAAAFLFLQRRNIGKKIAATATKDRDSYQERAYMV